jgi:vacuolar protein sorting-associated protein 72
MLDNTPSRSGGDTSDDEAVETLIAGRAKRSTAGRKMPSLLNAEADDDLVLLFAEDENDEEFDEDDEMDGDGYDVMDMGVDSTSEEEEDPGPNPAEDDLEGEMELQTQAKAEHLAKKRKAQESLRMTALRKKVRIDMAAIQTPASRPKKKSERISWLPTPEDGPIRSSSRLQTMRNKELTHARLKDSEKKRIRLIATMEEAAKRKERLKPKTMTQAERLAEAEKVERHNSKSLNRWEEMEKKKAEERRAKLEALQNRRLEGPVMSLWSGIAKWVNDKLTRVGSFDMAQKPEKQETEKKRRGKETESQDPVNEGELAKDASQKIPPQASFAVVLVNPSAEQTLPPAGDQSRKEDVPMEDATKQQQFSEKPMASEETDFSPPKRTGFLDSIRDCATLPDGVASPGLQPPPVQRNAPLSFTIATEPSKESSDLNVEKESRKQETFQQQPAESTPFLASASEESKQINPDTLLPNTLEAPVSSLSNQVGRSDEVSKAAVNGGVSSQDPKFTQITTAARPTIAVSTIQSNPEQQPSPNPFTQQTISPNSPPLATPPPSVVEYTGRTLLVLENFDDKSSQTREYSIYFNSKKPPRLAKFSSHLCVITSLPARYRDPSTGLPFANIDAFREIQRTSDQKYAWSSMLGCYVGPLESAARGVPERFLAAANMNRKKPGVGADNGDEESRMGDLRVKCDTTPSTAGGGDAMECDKS